MRVVLSMTTTPARNGTLGPTLRSIRAQTIQPDAVRLYASDDAGEWDAHTYGAELVHAVDRGPVTKLGAVQDLDLEDDDLIITIDDDIVYEPTWLETLLAAAAQHPTEAVGMSGWNAGRFLSRTHGSFEFVRPPASCDVLEGWSGAVYRRAWFELDVLEPPEEFRFVDDVWISSYLRRRGIGRRVVCRPLAAEAYPGRAGLHTRPDFKALNQRAARLGFS